LQAGRRQDGGAVARCGRAHQARGQGRPGAAARSRRAASRGQAAARGGQGRGGDGGGDRLGRRPEIGKIYVSGFLFILFSNFSFFWKSPRSESVVGIRFSPLHIHAIVPY